MKQGSEDWLRWRRKHVGSSDQTHLHWSAPWSIGWGKLWDIKMEKAPEQYQNPHMERGVKLEDEARFAYSLWKDLETFEPALVESKEFPYLAASLDAATSDLKHIAEIKCPGKEDHALAVAGLVPPKYIPQLYHQMFVTGLDEVDYVSFDGKKIAVVKIKRREETMKSIIDAAHKFHRFIQRNERPEGEWPAPEFDTRIPVITTPSLLLEVQTNLDLRAEVDRLSDLVSESDARILAGCDLPRAKLGGIMIVTTKREGTIDYSKVPALSGIDLTPYRKEGKTSRSLRRCK